jgi:hypothetical protein
VVLATKCRFPTGGNVAAAGPHEYGLSRGSNAALTPPPAHRVAVVARDRVLPLGASHDARQLNP